MRWGLLLFFLLTVPAFVTLLVNWDRRHAALERLRGIASLLRGSVSARGVPTPADLEATRR